MGRSTPTRPPAADQARWSAGVGSAEDGVAAAEQAYRQARTVAGATWRRWREVKAAEEGAYRAWCAASTAAHVAYQDFTAMIAAVTDPTPENGARR